METLAAPTGLVPSGGWHRPSSRPGSTRCQATQTSRREADPQQAAEALLDRGVERADHSIELGLVDGAHGQRTAQEHGILDADREVHANEPLVAPQEVLEELGRVLLGRRHHVRLVAQRPLAERQPHRREVLVLTTQPHVPATHIALGPVDRLDRHAPAFGHRPQPSVDAPLERGQRVVVVDVAHDGAPASLPPVTCRRRAGGPGAPRGRCTAAAGAPR